MLAHTGEATAGPAVPEEINHFSSRHPGGGSFAFADGHVAALSRSASYATFKALSTRSAGEALSAGDY